MNFPRLIGVALVAAWLVMSGAAPAGADPLTALVGSFFTFLGSGTIVATLARVAIGLGLSYLAQALSPKPQAQIGGISGTLGAGETVNRGTVVGRGVAQPSLVWANTYSSVGATPNASLAMVIALSDIPVVGLAEIWLQGEKLTWNPAAAPSATGEGIAIPEYTVAGKEHLWVRWYDGTQVAADTRLVTLFGTDADRPYTAARIGTGMAYVVVTALVNPEIFSGFPQLKFILDGVRLYDRREDSTAGGVGAQRWAVPATWTHTRNPVVIIENILRGMSYGATWVYGAQTVGNAQLPAASWFAAANACDDAIALDGGGTEPQYEAGGWIGFGSEPADAIEELLKASNGRLAEIGGVYKIRAGAPGVAVFAFSDGDIRTNDPQQFEPFPSQARTVNAVTAKYVSPAEGWADKDAPPLYDTSLETEDGGRRQPVDIRYGFVASGTAVQRLMKSARDSERAFRRHALPMPFEAFVLEPLDVVTWTSTRNGYIAKGFDIEAADDLPNLNMGLQVRELDPNAYDWTPATDEKPIDNGPLQIIRPPSQAITGWSAAGVLITNPAGLRRAGMLIGWDGAVEDVDGVQYEVRRAADAVVILRDQTDFVAAGALQTSQNLLSLTDYEARGKYRPHSDRETSWSGWLAFTTPDARISIDELDDILSGLVDGLDATIEGWIQGRLQDIETWLQRLADMANGTYAIIDASEGRIMQALGERHGENQARFISIATVLANETTALTQLLVALQASVGVNSASIVSLTTTMANADQALADLITALTADTDENSASIVTLTGVQTSLQAAIAAIQTTLTAVTDSGIGVVKIRFGAASTPDGVVASIKMEVSADDGVSYGEAGIYIDAMPGFSRTRLKGSQVVLESDTGEIINALLLAAQSEPRNTPIVTEGGSPVVRANMTGRQTRHKTVMTGNAQMRAPTGLASMDYMHIVEQDGTGGRVLTYSSEFIAPQPSGLSTVANAINVLRCSVLSVNPAEIAAAFDRTYTRTPTLVYRSSLGGFNAGSVAGNYAFDISALNFVPGNLLVVFAYGTMKNTAGAFGTWVWVRDNAVADWTSAGSQGSHDTQPTNAASSDRLRVMYKIAEGNEASIAPLQFSASTSADAAVAYYVVAFDMLGGVATPDATVNLARGGAVVNTQTINAGAHSAPVAALSWAANIDINLSTGNVPGQFLSVAPDQNVTLTDSYGGAPFIASRLKIKTQTAAPANITTSLNTAGISRALASLAFYLN